MTFWIIAAALAVGIGVLLALALIRGRPRAEPPAAYDLRVYRDQLGEIERDAARGVISGDEAERMRAEVSRRILKADAQLRTGRKTGGQPRFAGPVTAVVAVVAVAGGGLLLYSVVGSPGYRDMPLGSRIAASDAARADRLGQEAAEERFGSDAPEAPADVTDEQLALVERLREVVATRPEDQQGLRFLVRSEAALGRMQAARAAQEKLVALRGESASAADHATLAELMIEAADGYVSSDAEGELRAALEQDPRTPTARFYLGVYFLQVDRPDRAFRLWRDLLEESRENAPWVPVIRSEIGAVARAAGVDYEPPAPRAAEGGMMPPGPSAGDMAAAEDMDPAARNEMIRGMVSRLADRLAREGGPAEDWARLINAYGVLGEQESARRIWAEARESFAGDPERLALIRQAARAAGVVE